MRAEQLKETTMNPQKRTLLRVSIDAIEMQETKHTVESLMGTKPEARFRFIQENSTFASNLDI